MSEGFVVVQRGEGESQSIGAMTQLMGREEWTEGAYCIHDQVMAPHLMSAVHAHARDDQVAWVLEGMVTCWVDGEEHDVHAGGYALRRAVRPRTLHSLNAPLSAVDWVHPKSSSQNDAVRAAAILFGALRATPKMREPRPGLSPSRSTIGCR